MKIFKFSRKRLVFLVVVFVGAMSVGYFVVPELLVAAAGLLISDTEPFPADAIVVLAGGGPDRSREAAEIYRTGLASQVVLTVQELPDSYRELERMGIDFVLPHENDVRVLTGLGVPDTAIVQIESIVAETTDELTKVREYATDQGWTRLIVVTSNYHTSRVSLIVRYVFDSPWQVAVVGSRYSQFRPDGWWRDVGDARIFLVEFQKLILYELILRPRIWF
jgi:uncharacterized SAM-binding protein YcdF (DUF218 family)